MDNTNPEQPTPQQFNNTEAYSPPAQFIDSPEAPRKQSKKWLVSLAYLPEYFIMLVSLGSILAAITTLVRYGINGIGANNSASQSYSYFDSFSSFSLVISLASLAVFVPIFSWLYVRTRGTERIMPLVRAHRWRKAFLGVFIVTEILTVIFSLVWLGYDLVSRVIPEADLYSSYTNNGADEVPLWKPILTTVISATITLFVVWIVSIRYKQTGAEGTAL